MKEGEPKNQQQLKDDHIKEKLKEIRKDIAEANEIAKFMGRKIELRDIYVCKVIDDGYVHKDV